MFYWNRSSSIANSNKKFPVTAKHYPWKTCAKSLNLKEFFDIQATIECGFTLKPVRDMTGTCSQMHRTDKYSDTAQSFKKVDQSGQMVECSFTN